MYPIGVAGLILVLTSIYLVMPPIGRIRPRHALIGGIVVGLLWEATRHIRLWYFSTLSVVGVVYGSLATTIVGPLSLEIASIVLLLGAQVIAEYERLQDGETATPGEPNRSCTRLKRNYRWSLAQRSPAQLRTEWRQTRGCASVGEVRIRRQFLGGRRISLACSW